MSYWRGGVWGAWARTLAPGLVAFALVGCGADALPEAPAGPSFSEGHPPAAHPPANVVGGFTIDVPPIELSPGEEVTPCFLFPLDISGPSRIVGGGVLRASPGMHHGNITTRKKSGEGVRPCPADIDEGIGGEAGDILEGGAVLFGSSTQVLHDEWQSFPDGIGYRLRDGYEIVARMHYLNASGAPLTVAPRYEWFTIDGALLEHEVGPFAWTFRGFEIPPRSELTVTGGCRFPVPMHIVNALPHMHQLGTAFTVDFMGGALDGRRFLDSPGYDPERGVIVQYDPAIDLSQGDGARFSCTWSNVLDKTIVEGIGDNEMCILFGYAYPPENAYTALATGEDACLVIPPPTFP